MAGEKLLEGQAVQSWRLLSEQVQTARHHHLASSINEALLEHVKRDPNSPIAGPLLLWTADNLALEARFEQAATRYRELVKQYAGDVFAGIDLEASALQPLGDCQERFEEPDAAIKTYRRLAELGPERFSPAWALYQVGRVAEWSRLEKDAAEAYQAAASAPDTPKINQLPMPELAARAAKRLMSDRPGLRQQPEDVADALAAALSANDDRRLRELASATHFMLGIGGHFEFHDAHELIDRLHGEHGEVRADPKSLTGHGAKRYLHTQGWQGDWFSGRVSFLITRSSIGWEWSGIALTELTASWVKHFEPHDKPPNQVIDIPIKAPWPAGIRMRAGGLRPYILEQATIAVAAAVWPVGPFLALAATAGLAARDCGFGPGVLYHDMQPTHADRQDRFAVDFVRYQQFVPYHNIAGSTPALAVSDGIVTARQQSVTSGTSGADPMIDNRVEIRHVSLASVGNGLFVLLGQRWKSKYLHFQGPMMVPVSPTMFVRQGARLGIMDDTGNSFLDHLHFSMHDITDSDRSAKATPMDGQSLDTADDGRCVLSSNIPFP